MAETKGHYVEFGIEFCLELAIGLYQLGAEQMDLPHNFYVGLFLWVVATALALRMFWIFPKVDVWPAWLKTVIASAAVIVLITFTWKPISIAHAKSKTNSNRQIEAILPVAAPQPGEASQPSQQNPENQTPNHKPRTDSVTPPANTTRITYSVTNPTGSIVNQGSPNFGTQTVNNQPPPRILSESQKEKMLSDLSVAPQRITIASLIGDEEAANLATSIADVFEKSGWIVDRVIGRQMMGGRTSEATMLSFYAPVGTTKTNNQTVVMAISALRGAGFKVGLNADSTMSSDTVNLYVGSRRSE